MVAENGLPSSVPILFQFMYGYRNKHLCSQLNHNIPTTRYNTLLPYQMTFLHNNYLLSEFSIDFSITMKGDLEGTEISLFMPNILLISRMFLKLKD